MENAIIDEATAKKITPVIERMLKSYTEKDDSLSDEDWLIGEMKKELSDYAEEQIVSMSKEIISEVKIFDKNLADLNEAREKYEDLTNEQWLRDKLIELSKDTPIEVVGEKLLKAEDILSKTNDKAMESLYKELGWSNETNANGEAVVNIPVPKEWNVHNVKSLTTLVGKQAALAGARGMIANAGLQMAQKIYNGEEIKANDVIAVAIRTGADEGIKIATSAAMKICAEKGLIPVMAKGTPAGIIVNTVCIGIENIKILKKFADGEISGMKAMDLIARTSTSAACGMVGGTVAGIEAGVIVGAAFGPIGTILGGLVGGAVGYLAGSSIGNAIYSGAKAIGGIAVSAAKGIWSGVKSVGSAAVSCVKSVGRAIGSIFSW